VSATTYDITSILLKCMAKYKGVSIEKFVSRWVCLGYDEDFVFLGHIEISYCFFSYWYAPPGTPNQSSTCCFVQTTFGVSH
jgi:hypothetical protein